MHSRVDLNGTKYCLIFYLDPLVRCKIIIHERNIVTLLVDVPGEGLLAD